MILQPGDYYMHVEAGPNNPANSGDFSLSVQGNYSPPPLSGIQGPSAVAGCTSHTYSTTEGFDSYWWGVPSGAQIVSSEPPWSITVNFDESSGSVSVVAGNGCGSNSANLYVVVDACPPPTPTPTPAPTPAPSPAPPPTTAPPTTPPPTVGGPTPPPTVGGPTTPPPTTPTPAPTPAPVQVPTGKGMGMGPSEGMGMGPSKGGRGSKGTSGKGGAKASSNLNAGGGASSGNTSVSAMTASAAAVILVAGLSLLAVTVRKQRRRAGYEQPSVSFKHEPPRTVVLAPCVGCLLLQPLACPKHHIADRLPHRLHGLDAPLCVLYRCGACHHCHRSAFGGRS